MHVERRKPVIFHLKGTQCQRSDPYLGVYFLKIFSLFQALNCFVCDVD